MLEVERQAFMKLVENVEELGRNRDDMLIGIVAALLDLYRSSIERGDQTKDDAVARLTAQKDWLAKEIQGQVGALFLEFLIATLRADKLDAAKWLRQPTVGSA